MMRGKLLVFSMVLASLLSLNAQELTSDKVWNLLLKDVKIRYFYSLKYDALLPKPKFGKELKKIHDKTINIRGFFLPVDVTGNLFILSYNPMSTCFFCTGDGMQTIIELNVLPAHLKKFERLKTDNYFEVRGKLKLNSKSSEHLFYIMDDVELVKVIK